MASSLLDHRRHQWRLQVYLRQDANSKQWLAGLYASAENVDLYAQGLTTNFDALAQELKNMFVNRNARVEADAALDSLRHTGGTISSHLLRFEQLLASSSSGLSDTKHKVTGFQWMRANRVVVDVA